MELKSGLQFVSPADYLPTIINTFTNKNVLCSHLYCNSLHLVLLVWVWARRHSSSAKSFPAGCTFGYRHSVVRHSESLSLFWIFPLLFSSFPVLFHPVPPLFCSTPFGASSLCVRVLIQPVAFSVSCYDSWIGGWHLLTWGSQPKKLVSTATSEWSRNQKCRKEK